MDDSLSLILNVVFSAIGMGYFVYGKRQKALIPVLCGVGLMVYPLFVSQALLMILTGAGLMLVPRYLKL